MASGNSCGKVYRLTSFGESHGIAIGGVIDGCPAGLSIDYEFIQKELDKRKPGQSELVSQRQESDQVEFFSGIFDNKSTGTPIGFRLLNQDQRPKDYSNVKDIYRPSHADFTYEKKYGIRDYRGGGRSSARETAVRVVAGAIAKLMLREWNIHIGAFTSRIGEVDYNVNYKDVDLEKAYDSLVRCPDIVQSDKMIEYLNKVIADKDSVGGIVTCIINGVPPGIGEPVFDKLHAELGKAMLSINAAKGFQYGSGFNASKMRGSEHNDEFLAQSGKQKVRTKTNYSGGIQGGISNGETIYFDVAFKPASSIGKAQKTVNARGESVDFSISGRHDPCIVPRAVPVVESMAAIVLADLILRNQTSKISRQ